MGERKLKQDERIILDWSPEYRRTKFIAVLRKRGLTDAELFALGVSVRFESSRLKKDEILRLARSSESRPRCSVKDEKERTLGKALVEYLSPKGSCYDHAFSSLVKELRPDWFLNTAQITKDKLLELARTGKPKPREKSGSKEEMGLGVALRSYRSASHRSYDPSFKDEIEKIRPDWFQLSSDIRKAELLIRAGRGETKPVDSVKGEEQKLAKALASYTNPSNLCYDAEFSNQILKLREDWFIKSTVTNKALVRAWVRSGKPRPNTKSKDKEEARVAALICAYTNTRGLDEELNEELRQVRPDWFKDKLASKKEELLKLARSGAARPASKKKDQTDLSKLSGALSRYTNPNSDTYDISFTSQISNIRPDWFIDTAAEKKSQILHIARTGGKKPSSYSKVESIKILASALHYYLGKQSTSYDSHFVSELMSVRPDWFKSSSEVKKEKLIDMARNGVSKLRDGIDPEQTTLYKALHSYVSPKSGTYDSKFALMIRRLRSDWF
jgi:hypothetical protein